MCNDVRQTDGAVLNHCNSQTLYWSDSSLPNNKKLSFKCHSHLFCPRIHVHEDSSKGNPIVVVHNINTEQLSTSGDRTKLMRKKLGGK